MGGCTVPFKTAVTSGLNVMHSQTSANLFPLHKLKGNCTFATTIGNDEAEEDPDEKSKGEGETEPSAEEGVEVSGRIRNGPIHQVYSSFHKRSNYTKRKTQTVLGVGS